MREIRLHGRGGQGVVVASRVIGAAACAQGLYVQAFPMFGPEREGAPVMAFVRLSHEPIWLRSQVMQPDTVAILDETLFEVVDPLAGLRQGGELIINQAGNPSKLPQGFRCHCVDVLGIAVRRGLGTRTSPLASTAFAGAVCRALGVIEFDALIGAVRSVVSWNVEPNVQAAAEGFEALVRPGGPST